MLAIVLVLESLVKTTLNDPRKRREVFETFSNASSATSGEKLCFAQNLKNLFDLGSFLACYIQISKNVSKQGNQLKLGHLACHYNNQKPTFCHFA